MNLRLLLGWGIAIYAVLYLVWAGLVVHGLSGSVVSRMLALLTLFVVVTIATRSLRLLSERDVLSYAIGWVVIAVFLDAIFAVPAAGWGMYADWNVWVGYTLLFILPFIVTAVSKKRTLA